MRMRLLAAAVLLLAGGCATSGPDGEAAEQARTKSRIFERQRAVTTLGQEFRFIWEPEVFSEVDRIGQSVSAAVGLSERKFHFYVIDRPTVNAFTSPLGDIFIFSGMLQGMRNSSELAGVFAHEIAHVRARHFVEIQKRAALSTIPGLMAAILSRGDPRVIIGALAAAQAYQLHWSRDMELEADTLALLYLRKTGYDVNGLLGGLKIIERGERLVPVDVPRHLLTHPIASDRIAAMETGLGMSPGERYSPSADPAWNRLLAVLKAAVEHGSVTPVNGESVAGSAGEKEGLKGLTLLRQGKYGESEDALRAALALDPGNVRYLADLGGALFHRGKTEEARTLLKGVLKTPWGEKSAYVRYYLGAIYEQDGDEAASLLAYEEAVTLWPPLPEAHYRLALLLSAREELGKADYYFGRSSRLRGDYVSALRSFNRAAARLGRNPLWGRRIDGELAVMQ
jgi:predicted Zn-dependent protease